MASAPRPATPPTPGRAGAPEPGPVALADLNAMDVAAFVGALGWIFEGSPWIAERAYAAAPFASRDALHAAMVRVVAAAGRDAQLALIRAHPDLAGRVALASLSAASQGEQAGAGLDRMTPEQFARFHDLNARYRARFGFPFVIAVRGHTRESVLATFERRLAGTQEEEMAEALHEIGQIARFRLQDAVAPADAPADAPAVAPAVAPADVGSGTAEAGERKATIRYGKAGVTFYRTYARPLAGLTPIRESAFTRRANVLFAATVDVEVFGDNFLPAYTEGDNSLVVATDTMKNVVHEQAIAYDGATLEGFLAFLGSRFLATYPQMQSLRLRGHEEPFAAATVPLDRDDGGNGGFGPSGVLFGRMRGERAMAEIALERRAPTAGAAGDSGSTGGTGEIGGAVVLTGHRCGVEGLQLIKVTGSSFTRFVRDGYTTLPESVDRPLFIYLDVYWRYAAAGDVTGADPSRYVAAEQVRDCVSTVFHEFVSQSIQHLVHEMAQRLLARFPQLAEVAFEAQNRLWDTATISAADPKIKSYCDPRPPYGSIGLVLRR